jgi:hypothetical protein
MATKSYLMLLGGMRVWPQLAVPRTSEGERSPTMSELRERIAMWFAKRACLGWSDADFDRWWAEKQGNLYERSFEDADAILALVNETGLRAALEGWLSHLDNEDMYRGWFLRTVLTGLLQDPVAFIEEYADLAAPTEKAGGLREGKYYTPFLMDLWHLVGEWDADTAQDDLRDILVKHKEAYVRPVALPLAQTTEGLRDEYAKGLVALFAFEKWWRLPNVERTIAAIEPAMRLCLEALGDRPALLRPQAQGPQRGGGRLAPYTSVQPQWASIPPPQSGEPPAQEVHRKVLRNAIHPTATSTNDTPAPKRVLAADEQVQIRVEPHESSPAPMPEPPEGEGK